MKPKVYEILSRSSLFKGFRQEELERLLTQTSSQIQEYQKGEYVFQEDDVPNRLLVLLEGSLIVAKDTLNGKRTILTRIEDPGEMFGEIYPFIGLPRYEMYVEALKKSQVLSIDIAALESSDPLEEKMRRNLMTIFAQKAYRMNQRLRVLGASGIRGKIARFLVNTQKGQSQIRTMPREEMADYLNVTRPSLSRELSNMVNEGILKIDGRNIIILDQEALEEFI